MDLSGLKSKSKDHYDQHLMRQSSLYDRFTIHYQPIAGGTTKTMCVEFVDQESDGTMIFRTLSDAARLENAIRYDPNGKSKRISISEGLTEGQHMAPIEINGIIRWTHPFEIHAYTTGWRTHTNLGGIYLNIPGIEGMQNKQKDTMRTKAMFENHKSLRVTAGYDRRHNESHVSVDTHPNIDSVDEIRYDDLNWFHEAYPLSGSSAGVRIGFDEYMEYKGLKHEPDATPYSRWCVTREYGEKKTTKNPSI